MKNILVITISVLTLFLASCAEFAKYESSELASAPTVTTTLEASMDSSIVVSLSSTATGFISFALFEGVGNPVPDSSLLIKLNVTALETASGQVLQAGEKMSYEFTGLTQNTKYEVFAVAQNDDGVLSNVTEPLMVSTTDVYVPVLSDVAPATSYDPEQAIDMQVTLTFDEPVGSVDVSKFSFSYLFEGVDAAAATAEVNPEDPYQVIVSQSRAAHAADYIMLSYEEGAVMDIVGNKVEALASGLNDAGDAFVGLFWRAEKIAFDIDVATFAPANGAAVADPDFVVTFSAPVAVEFDGEDGSIRFVVVGAGVKSVYEVPAANVAIDEDGTTISIAKPFSPTYGEWVYIEMDGGTFIDDFSNPCNLIESGVDGIAGEEDVVTEIGWLISYGYSIDMVLGSYTYAGTSYWEDSDETFDVEIIADPDTENGVIINGFYGSETPIPAIFNGDFATLTIQVPEDDFALGDLFDDGGETYFWSYEDTQFVLNIDADGNMVTDPAYWMALYWIAGDASDESWVNIFTASNWTKTDGGINIENNNFVELRSQRIPRNAVSK